MNEPTTSGITRVGTRLRRGAHQREMDAFIDQYLSWRERCAAVAATYQVWRAAAPKEQARAFAMYSAALDREEEAAIAYQFAVARVDVA
jgi:hypothetical protein